MSPKYVKKKQRLANKKQRLDNHTRVLTFKACCNFMDMTLEDFYIILHFDCDVSDYYEDYNSFKATWHQRSIAIAQKDGILDSVDCLFAELRDDIFRCMNNPILFPAIKDKWRNKIELIMEKLM